MMNNDKFMAYLIENNAQARKFLIWFITGFDNIKEVNLEYLDTSLPITKVNGKSSDKPIISYALTIITDDETIETNLMIANSMFVQGCDLFVGNVYSKVKGDDPMTFLISTSNHMDHYEDDHRVIIENSARVLDLLSLKDESFGYLNSYVKDIQLDYLDDEMMEANKSSLIYSFLYLLKYNQPYEQGNNIIDGIVDTYNEYLLEKTRINDYEFMVYLLENNIKVRKFLISLVTGLDNITLAYLDEDCKANYLNDKDILELNMKCYNLDLITNHKRLRTKMAILDNDQSSGFSLNIGVIELNNQPLTEHFVHIVDNLGDDDHRLLIEKTHLPLGYRPKGNIYFKCKYIQLDYLNEDVMKDNSSSLFYSFLYLLKYNKPYEEGNDIIDSIIESYDEYTRR